MSRGVGISFALIALFGGWLAWLFLGRVSVYATSFSTKIESTSLPLPLQSAVDGVVVQCNLQLSQHVREGEVLVRLDSHAFELKRDEAQANLDARVADVKALGEQIDAELAARQALADLVTKSESSGRAKVSVSRTTAHAKEQETKVMDQLSASELASKLDKLRAEGETATDVANVAATAAQAAQDVSGTKATLSDRDARIASLRRTLVEAERQADVVKASIKSIEYEIELRNIRAMARGTLADIAPCTPGMAVSPNQRLATLLPDSEMRAVAMFTPYDAVGRVHPNQQAIVRIDNFPWTQFGTLGASVEHVGSEPRDGLVRVELKINRLNPMIPVTHGLTGQVEIEIERASPFHLLLRAAGQLLAPAKATGPSSREAEDRDGR